MISRNLRKPRGRNGLRKRVVVGITETGKTSVLAAFAGLKWSMVNSPWSLKFPNANNDDGHLLEMTGPYTVRALHLYLIIFWYIRKKV